MSYRLPIDTRILNELETARERNLEPNMLLLGRREWKELEAVVQRLADLHGIVVEGAMKEPQRADRDWRVKRKPVQVTDALVFMGLQVKKLDQDFGLIVARR